MDATADFSSLRIKEAGEEEKLQLGIKRTLLGLKLFIKLLSPDAVFDMHNVPLQWNTQCRHLWDL